ncbi:adenosylcobinamide-phosphate synthase CbiB [Paenibacillus cremeus]|uniref:Cobalamin biosynthesis protein CobD n=1 Tax=Paenibacillus cremeus TaxID=2163881 RepID=A0A559K6C4_9BACL|nr:adenosylcobinamide-phosphate synthase CbiB [Paenibacillus cremeus]TVY07680.1 cobalamin biosynthesis protein CobD [Paenibacillus cremeus]
MLLYGVQETLWMVLAAIIVDWIVGDPSWRWLTHPVIWIGRWITSLEKALLGSRGASDQRKQQLGVLLTLVTVCAAFGCTWLIVWLAGAIHLWLGYAVNVWFISTTMAVKGLKEAAVAVYRPLEEGRMDEARKYVGYIVGRETSHLDEAEVTRAAVETVAENIVDAVVSPICYALLGGAPLAMLYRASNTLDSMVGYKNDKYLYFGWASARWDDVLNWLPARLTGLLLGAVAWATPGLSAARSFAAVRRFAHLHPSPNSGIPESAVAGALGIELGGVNVYHGRVSERARMGWPLRERGREDIVKTVRMMYAVSFLIAGGLLLCALWMD